MRRLRLLSIATVGLFTLSMLVPVGALAASSKDISQSYNSDSELRPGTLVSATSGDADRVTAANTQNANRLVGVVVEADNSLLAVNPDSNKVQVAKSGSIPVLVSNVNGDIKNGDRIAASPFNGIGMKAIGAGYIVGRAQGSFTAKSKGATEQQVTNKDGRTQTISVGYIQIDLNPKFDAEAGSDGLNGIQQWVRSLTGHTVSKSRVIVSVVVGVAAIIAVIVLMYASIYGSIISIGRNPLARQSIFRALAHVLLMAFLIIAVAFGLIYLLLR
ncbi:MAG TPA: hypothetical protein VGE30_03675 [Candidatus Saccharimonadales bacterium]